MRGPEQVRGSWSQSASIVMVATLLVSPALARSQGDVPLGARSFPEAASGRPFRALGDVVLCRTMDCARGASAAMEATPAAHWHLIAEETAGRPLVSPASPIATETRLNLFYGSEAHRIWVGRGSGSLQASDSLGRAPSRWLEYGAALRWRAVSVAVDAGTDSRPSRVPASTSRVYQSSDSLTGETHVDTVTEASASELGRSRWSSVALRIGWRSDAWRLGTVIGRASTRGGRSVTWSTVEGERRLGGSLALVASAGAYPGSLTAEARRGRWMVSLGLSAPTGWLSRRRPAPAAGDAPAPDRFVATRIAPHRYRVVARVRDAARVELASDLTGWQPVAMHRDAADAWSIEIDASSGAHHVSIRADDGPWVAPAGLAATDDDYGGSAGVLLIP